MVNWLRLGFGIVLLLLGVTWILQGFNLVKGSEMSGHGEWAVGGAVVLIFAVWLLWGLASSLMRLTGSSKYR